MKLIDGFDLRHAPERREGTGFASLPWAVVDHRNAGIECTDQYRIVAVINSMMIHLIHINCTGDVLWTRQTVFDVPGEVAAIKESEAAEGHQDADAL